MRRSHRIALCAAAALTAACVSNQAFGQLVSFPGAQGFGKDTTGGRNGSLYVVTNLNPTGPGSFEDAVSALNRIVVFAVSGTITLTAAVSAKSNITILGQTSPGQGIAIEGHEVSFSEQSNALIQYIRFREGSTDTSAKASLNLGDLIGGMVDHVSAEFSQYDNIDAVGANSTADNITYQNDLVADPILAQQLNLHEEGNQTTYLNNVFANSHGRDPLAKSNSQYVNNVAYDYGYAFTTGDSSGKFDYDILNNYFIPGPGTTSPGDAFYQLDSNQSAYSSGNLLNTNKGTLGGTTISPGGLNTLSSEYSPETQFLPTLTATQAVAFDTAHAGDSVENGTGTYTTTNTFTPTLGYDQLDTQIMSQVLSYGTAGRIFNEPDDDNFPAPYYGTTNGGSWTFVSSAGDDIPDSWAITHGMNPSSFAAATSKNALGYDMIEQYAQQMGDTYNTQVWANASGDWTTGTWSSTTPGDYDHAVIAGGAAATISNGDSASAFSVAVGGSNVSFTTVSGNGGESLNVTGGKLYVQDTIYVGDTANATFNISGGTVMANNVQLGNTVWDGNGNPTNYTGTFNFTGGILEVGQILNGVGSPNAWTSGGAWTWSGGTVQAWGNLNINAPATLGSGGGIVDTVGPDGVTYTGTISGAMSGTGGFAKIGAGSLFLSAANTYTGPTIVNGGILDVTGSIAANTSGSVFIAADATGNTKLIRTTPLGGSYAGYGSSVTSGLFSVGDILQGMNATNNPSATKTIAMNWRLRTGGETPGGIDSPGQISEVMTLTGMANTGTTGTGQTDPFALQMSFSPSYFSSMADESAAAANGQIALDWFNGSAWVNAVSHNFLTGADVFTNVQSSYANFALAEGITDSNLGTFLGSWGVDVTDNEAWAVVDHNSAFSIGLTAAVPEPASAGILLAMGAGCLTRRRRKTRA